MSDITHEQMLEALLEEKRQADQRAEGARRRTAIAEMEAARLGGAVAAIQALLPAVETVRQAVEVNSRVVAEASPQPLSPLRSAATPEFAEQDEADEDQTTDRKRVPSTEWAAEIVIDAARTMTREEVQDEFAHRHGIPSSWSDPISSISVALKRASQKGMITRTGRATYAPLEQTSDVEGEDLAMAE